MSPIAGAIAVGGDSADADGTRERLAALGEIAAEVAHELRNVLQIISASAYVARQEVDRGDAPGARPHLLRVERHARLAHAIVDDLMLLARGDALQKESVPLADVLASARVDEAATTTAAYADAITPPDLRARVHPALFARLLHTLYENAVGAAAPAAPRISTAAHVESGHLVIEISDDGPGVPDEIAARVFEPLVTARPGGTGLGLALARRIALAHGGSIALVGGESERESAAGGAVPRGARFRIEVPAQG